MMLRNKIDFSQKKGDYYVILLDRLKDKLKQKHPRLAKKKCSFTKSTRFNAILIPKLENLDGSEEITIFDKSFFVEGINKIGNSLR